MIRWVALCLVALWSCRRPSDSASPQPKSSRTGGVGVHVPLPDDWRVQVAEGENFRAGPPGRAVLRIDSNAMISTVPSAKELRARLQREDSSLSIRMLEEVDKPDTAVAVFEVNGERRPSFYAMLGVRRVQGQLFLCSTVPGATQADVRIAAQACANFSVK